MQQSEHPELHPLYKSRRVAALWPPLLAVTCGYCKFSCHGLKKQQAGQAHAAQLSSAQHSSPAQHGWTDACHLLPRHLPNHLHVCRKSWLSTMMHVCVCACVSACLPPPLRPPPYPLFAPVSCSPAEPGFPHDLVVSTRLHSSQLLAASFFGISHSLPLLHHPPQPLLGHHIDGPRLQLAVLHHEGFTV